METQSEVEVVDSGYDVFSYGQKTMRPFRIADFETVADFLEEPTGNSVATYESGSGMEAETYSERFYQDALEQIVDWVEKLGFVDGLDEDESVAAWEALSDALISLEASEVFGWIGSVKSFLEILTAFRDCAGFRVFLLALP